MTRIRHRGSAAAPCQLRLEEVARHENSASTYFSPEMTLCKGLRVFSISAMVVVLMKGLRDESMKRGEGDSVAPLAPADLAFITSCDWPYLASEHHYGIMY